MAKIIENPKGRRLVVVSTDDVINIVREYQAISCSKNSYHDIREALDKTTLFLPEELQLPKNIAQLSNIGKYCDIVNCD